MTQTSSYSDTATMVLNGQPIDDLHYIHVSIIFFRQDDFYQINVEIRLPLITVHKALTVTIFAGNERIHTYQMSNTSADISHTIK